MKIQPSRHGCAPHSQFLTLCLTTGMAAVFPLHRCAAERPPQRTAQRHVAQLQQDIREGLERRGIRERFEQYRAYTADRMDASAGENKFSDKTGNCRLDMVQTLLRNPIEALAVSEEFTWGLRENARDGREGLQRFIATAAETLDAGELPRFQLPREFSSPQKALDALAVIVAQATRALERAYAPLSEEQKGTLQEHLYPQTTGGLTLGHRFADSETGRRICDLLEKIDRSALLETADILSGLTDPALLEALGAWPREAAADPVPGVEGSLAHILPTPAGRILVGGQGDNRYDLEKLRDVCAIVELGGNDFYHEGVADPDRPVLAILDLGGDDVFEGQQPGIQGGAILGASLLFSMSGTDRFQAENLAQGSALGGIGILIKNGGEASYTGRCRVQGQAVGGLGLLLDRAGNDRYRAAMLSQGVGGPLGFGSLVDLEGDDHYYAGGAYSGGYNDSPGFGAWSQGVGVGPRGIANGGIGVLLDGGGDDLYEYDYFSHGGGYWFAAGFARDFGGNDRRIGATRTRFDGSERDVKRFVRWGVGYGCHYAMGFVIDDAGDDEYIANTAALAFAWDIAVGAILDFGGNDLYQGSGAAHASNAGLAALLDVSGDDIYKTRSLGYAREVVDYHPVEKAGGNFAFLIDRGGNDDFGPELENQTESERGWAGGFFISQP